MALAPIIRTVGYAAGGALLNEVFNLFPGIFGMNDAEYGDNAVNSATDSARTLNDPGVMAAYAVGHEGQVHSGTNAPTASQAAVVIKYRQMAYTWCETRFSVGQDQCGQYLKAALPYVLAGLRYYKNVNSTYAVKPELTATSTSNDMAALMNEMDALYQIGLQQTGAGGGAGTLQLPGNVDLGGSAAGYVQGGMPQIPGIGAGPMPQSAQEFFGSGMCGVRPARNVQVQGPNGKIYWFSHRGTPLLWSGDFAAAKRVERAAKKAAKISGYTVRRRGSGGGSSRTRRR